MQDRYNVNTVPTVVRLTNKLLKTYNPEEKKTDSVPNERKYPFCPLCLGVREPIHNLLEVGSTIDKIEVKEGEPDKAVLITDSA